MSRTIVILRRAARQIAAARSWWYRHRDKAPHAFDEDLDEAFAKIAETPFIGPIARDSRMRDVRRVLLPRTQHHIYYRLLDEIIEIVALWHASRRSGPRL